MMSIFSFYNQKFCVMKPVSLYENKVLNSCNECFIFEVGSRTSYFRRSINTLIYTTVFNESPMLPVSKLQLKLRRNRQRRSATKLHVVAKPL